MADASARAWLDGQVAAYTKLLPHYRKYGEVLERLLRIRAARIAPLAIVQTRTKAVASFAEKALRKRATSRDPVHEFTDLCGARVICRTPSEVEAVCRFVEEGFEIDLENSEVKGQPDIGWRSRAAAAQTGPTEFGYRSIHYIVSLGDGAKLGIDVPKAVRGLRAEVQVRTVAEHAWSDFGHDLSYKGAFELPVKWKRELAIIAAELEDVDRAFDRIEQGLGTYASSYGSYLTEKQLDDEIATLETVLEYDQGNAHLAARIGKLAITRGDWQRAVEVLSRHVDPQDLDASYQPLLRDLGIALCKLHRAAPTGRDYARGQRYLAKAAELSGGKDAEAIASLAGTWKRTRGGRGDEGKARDLYRQAFEADPSDFYPLTNFLEYEIRRAGDTFVVALLAPSMRAAIDRCRAQAAVRINVPWVFYGMAQLHLLLGEPYESLRAYAKAVEASTADHMVEGSLESLTALAGVSGELGGYEWARRMLLAGRAAKFSSRSARAQLRKLSSGGYQPEREVLIVVGGTDPSLARSMAGYRALMTQAFRDFEGTIISGGTRQGVSGLVGEIRRKYPDRIEAVGYLPRRALPGNATIDDRYTEIRRTDSTGFSPLEPLQNWIDLIASGIDPRRVKVLGVGGGDIAAIEYRIALALGATVGVVEHSGRAASRLLGDEHWTIASLVPLPDDPETVRAFVGSHLPGLGERDRETIARDIHERHRAETAAQTSSDPFMRPWDELPDGLQDSSRQQADHMFDKLRAIGCTVEPVGDRGIAPMTFTPEEVELMAEMEHGRWNAERLAAGWRWAERKDTVRKRSPYLVPWSDLPEEIREFDRSAVRDMPMHLAAVQLEVRRNGRALGVGRPHERV